MALKALGGEDEVRSFRFVEDVNVLTIGTRKRTRDCDRKILIAAINYKTFATLRCLPVCATSSRRRTADCAAAGLVQGVVVRRKGTIRRRTCNWSVGRSVANEVNTAIYIFYTFLWFRGLLFRG